MSAPAPSLRLAPADVSASCCSTMRATMATASSPNVQPNKRRLRRMSPLRMWLNSCAITPCSSSRLSRVAAPRVTAMAASAGELPAAKALMPSSFSSTYTSGMVTPEAMAISSTTLCRRLSARSPVLRSMRVPPSERATAPPPARNERVLKRLAPQMMPSTTTLVAEHRRRRRCARGSAAPTTNTTTASTARTTSTTEIRNATRSQRVVRRAASWRAKKSI